MKEPTGFSDFHPVKISPCFRNPMGNHNPEAWSAQANSQIGGTFGENRNERVLTWQQPPRTHDDTARVRIMTESGIML